MTSIVAVAKPVISAGPEKKKDDTDLSPIKNALDSVLESKRKVTADLLPKDFFWDQFLKYISAATLSQVLLTLSVSFFNRDEVLCFQPLSTASLIDISNTSGTIDLQRSHSTFTNKYCEGSTPITRHFPVFILLHGLLLSVPHFIWNAVFKGDFDSFFTIVDKIERLRNSETGEYNQKNFDMVAKLEKEYGKKKDLIWGYVMKLVFQLFVCIGTIMISGLYLTDFSFSFNCPYSLAETGVVPHGWPWKTTVSCVYIPLISLGVIRYVDISLTSLAAALILYGLVWCAVRHTGQLGYKQIALFIFQSGLSADSYTFPPVLKFKGRSHIKLIQNQYIVNPIMGYFTGLLSHSISPNLKTLFCPRIKSDMDFLVLLLYRADANLGKVFRNIQITSELRELIGRDHQLLHLYISIQKDVYDKRGKLSLGSCSTDEGQGDLQSFWSCCRPRKQNNDSSSEAPMVSHESKMDRDWLEKPSMCNTFRAKCFLSFCCCCFRKRNPRKQEKKRISDSQEHDDFRKLFFDDVFTHKNPEKRAYFRFRKRLGNVDLLYQDNKEFGMRDMIYWFVGQLVRRKPSTSKEASISNNIAIDISFGTAGYRLPLARQFNVVYSLDFNPYYRNEEKVVMETSYLTNYTVFTIPDNIFSSNKISLSEFHSTIFERFAEDFKVGEGMTVDMILVGPITNEYHKVSFNILLQQMYQFISKGTLLLALRPLKIGKEKCSFFKYVPPKKLFKHYIIKQHVATERETCSATIDHLCITDTEKEKIRFVDGELGFKVKCGGAPCVFEFEAYWYIGENDKNSTTTDLPGGNTNGSTHSPIVDDSNVPSNSLVAQHIHSPHHSLANLTTNRETLTTVDTAAVSSAISKEQQRFSTLSDEIKYVEDNLSLQEIIPRDVRHSIETENKVSNDNRPGKESMQPLPEHKLSNKSMHDIEPYKIPLLKQFLQSDRRGELLQNESDQRILSDRRDESFPKKSILDKQSQASDSRGELLLKENSIVKQPQSIDRQGELLRSKDNLDKQSQSSGSRRELLPKEKQSLSNESRSEMLPKDINLDHMEKAKEFVYGRKTDSNTEQKHDIDSRPTSSESIFHDNQNVQYMDVKCTCDTNQNQLDMKSKKKKPKS